MTRNKHMYHLVSISPWPLFVGFFAWLIASSLGFYISGVSGSGWFLIFNLCTLIYCVYFWLTDILDEGTNCGFHTLTVRNGLRLGFLLFILSEIMLFFGFFWAFFHAALCPGIEIGLVFPPVGIVTISVIEFPLFNTFILLISGLSITWVHRAMSLGSFKEAIDGFIITIVLGYLFIILQMLEYYELLFNFADSIYSCSFFMLTGLHGLHVFAGVTCLLLCFLRLLKRHFLTNHYLGLVFAIWYWHFVDVVWIFLYLSIYCWGSW